MATRILLADDSITIQKVVELTFSEGDFEVFSVSNGQQALDRLAECNPDIALLDVIMPEKSGYEVCHEIKQDPRFRDLPVLLLTGTFEPFDPERARTSGADGHITKPFESRTLIAKVEELLAVARPARETDMEAATGPPPDPTGVVDIPISTGSLEQGVRPDLEAGSAPVETAGGVGQIPVVKEVTPDWVAGDFGQDLPTAAEIEKGFGSEPEWESAPETPDPLIKTGMTQAIPLGGVGMEPEGESADGPEEAETAPEPVSDFGRTMAIEVPSEPPPSAPTVEERAFSPTPEDLGPDTEGRGAGPEDTPWGAPPVEPPARPVPDSGTADGAGVTGAAPAGAGFTAPHRGDDRPPSSTGRFGVPEPPQPAAPPAESRAVALSQESIDTIARRVVEKLSDQIVREIAWEVVPDLAESLIRKRIQELEEKIGD